MKNDLIYQLTESFEDHAQETESGIEYWLARDIQHLLSYTEWRNFLYMIFKAKTAYELSEKPIEDHFADVGKMVERRLVSAEKKVLKSPKCMRGDE